MGHVYAEIELVNGDDLAMVRKSIIDQADVKKLRVTMMADSGAYMLCINEIIQSQLELPLIEKRKLRLANEQVVEYDVVGPVHVCFANRKALCSALVLPGESEPLLGAIPMEEMDVIIHPRRQELIVHPDHPNFAVLKLKSGINPAD